MKSQKERREEKKKKEKEDAERMWKLFEKIWLKRPHYSELSWTWLGRDLSSLYFHHILPKRNYEDAKFDEDNIILVTWEEHENVERDITRYEEINKRREKLMKKYG